MSEWRESLDKVGPWSQVKHDVLRRYAEAYSKILAKQTRLSHGYIEGFTGCGMCKCSETGKLLPGSALVALDARPSFQEYHFVELDPEKARVLGLLIDERAELRERCFTYIGDCNEVLPRDVFPKFAYEDYRRALCLLDPYGLDLDWGVIEAAGKMRSIEVMINFPVMDINRNVFWRNPQAVSEDQKIRMTRFWGDESWQEVAWSKDSSLFGDGVKTDIQHLLDAFQRRLQEVAGFPYVCRSKHFANQCGSTLYYLVFATHNETGHRIGSYVLGKFGRA